MDDVTASPVLSELLDSALPLLRTGRDLKAFIKHMERILGQLALIGGLQEATSK